MSYQNKYRLLAFVTLWKLQKRNSIVRYKKQSKVARAKELGISYNLFKTLLKQCIDNNLVRETKNGHIVLIKLTTILEFLNKDERAYKKRNFTFNKYLDFFKKCTYEKISFKIIYNQIRKAVVLKNYRQQQYRIDNVEQVIVAFKDPTYRFKVGEPLYRAILRRASKTAHSSGISADEYVDRLTGRKTGLTIVSGKHHVGKLIGMSSATGQRVLKDLATKEVTRKKVDHIVVECRDSLQYAGLVDRYGAKNHIILGNRAVYLSKGSEIILNERQKSSEI